MKKSIKKTSFDLISLVILVGLDLSLNWSTNDLVWSFWLSSICVGYLTIISSIFKLPIFILEQQKKLDKTAKVTKHLNLIVFGLAIFMLGFFFVHFLGFHLGHSVFLKSAFPLEGFVAKSKGLVDPGYLFSILAHLLPMYWPFVLVSLFNKKDVFNKSVNKFDLREISIGPYQNVIKIHLLIFVIVGLNSLKIDKLIIHAIVLIVFVTDFSGLMKKKKRRSRKRPKRKKLSA
jgi:hypothetical protein